ncbi:MAG: winged helix-turn-helix domain-containing protein [Phenylobacterium sp.]|uniref:winged helix-turn-helix domain-containing protein n=1 Tax=Phenylobacterium sp. TaxID=1871053 RepID=UPI003919026C
MNEHVAIRWPELSLARETPFRLAGTEVRPSALEVETDGQVTALEPRVMKVLVALHRARGEPVSRDELIELCWGGRIVTEGALNRCVAQLRKALAADPRIRLDTIATVGYRLQADRQGTPEPISEARPAPAPPGRGRLRLGLAGAGAVVLLAAAAAVLALPKPVTWTAEAFHPLTTEIGLETHPALSPSGEQIVYAQRTDMLQTRDLYLRSVEQGTPVQITTDPADDYGAVWSPRGDRIAFVRTPAQGPCRVVVVPIPLGPEREVGRCVSAASMRLTWLGEGTLAISDRPTASDIWRIRTLDIQTGAVADLTDPPASTLGDGDPAASPDGRYVVFRRTLLHGAHDLFLKDVRTGRERPLTTDGWKAAGYVWSADSRHIFYASNRGGEFGLWTVDVRRDAPPQRVSLGFGRVSFSRMSADRRNRLAVEIPTGRTNLAALTANGEILPVTNASGFDWHPRAAGDGAIAYVSDRSGSFELWVNRPDGGDVRLTSLLGSYLDSPAWSPDGASLAFVVVKGRRSDLYTIGRDGSRLRAITSDGLDKLDPVFAPDGSALTYVQRTEAGYRLMRIETAPGAQPAPVSGGEGWRALRAGPDGRLFGLRQGEDRVRALDGGSAPEIRLGDYDAWSPGADGVYVVRAPRGEIPMLWRHPWRGAPERIGPLPGFDGALSMDPQGRALFNRNLDNQVDIGLVDLGAS